MEHKMKKNYLVNNQEYYSVDSLEEFFFLIDNDYHNADKITSALYKMAITLKSQKNLKTLENLITRFCVFNFDDSKLITKDNKTYCYINIISVNVPQKLNQNNKTPQELEADFDALELNY